MAVCCAMLALRQLLSFSSEIQAMGAAPCSHILLYQPCRGVIHVVLQTHVLGYVNRVADSVLLRGTQVVTQFGRPNWTRIIGDVADNHPGQTVGVFV